MTSLSGCIAIPKDLAIFLLQKECLDIHKASIYLKGFMIASWNADDTDEDGELLPDPDELYAEISKDDVLDAIQDDPDYTDFQLWLK